MDSQKNANDYFGAPHLLSLKKNLMLFLLKFRAKIQTVMNAFEIYFRINGLYIFFADPDMAISPLTSKKVSIAPD